MEDDFGRSRIKAFVFEFTKRTAVDRISIRGIECFDIEVMWSTTDFFVWCEGNTNATMLDFWM